jgi:asparaginyl-tRNA synthetase
VLDAEDGGRSLIGSRIKVCGWVRTARVQKDVAFIKFNDGSTFKEMQAVLEKGAKGWDKLGTIGAGASVRIEGEVVESPAKGQEVEVSCTGAEMGVDVLGTVDGASYPLAKKRHSIEFLRTIAHLRPRSNLIGAVSRVRNALADATHRFFQDRGFLYVHTPIITTADCEGAGEMFQLAGGAGTEGEEFFGEPAYLTVSGQLAVENFCCSLGDVYTFGPTFRAEKSSTARHLAEFWMIEPEMAFADLKDDMDCAEDYVRFCAKTVLETCTSDLEFFQQRVDKEVVNRLKLIASKPFKRMSYTEAVEVLEKEVASGKAKFEFEVAWGKELQTEHEKWLTDQLYKCPTIVYNYPKDCKAFYMRLNDDDKTVAAMDILCPGIGELIGGSQREERLDRLDGRIEELGLNQQDFWWYRDLRQYGTVPHAGFGLGFERLIMLCTGVQNIRDVIPFPRYPGHAQF